MLNTGLGCRIQEDDAEYRSMMHDTGVGCRIQE